MNTGANLPDMDNEPNLYELLQVSPNADERRIRAAFRSLAAELHPDKPGGDHERFVQLEQARYRLLDPVSRADYDLALARQSPSTPASPSAPVRDTPAPMHRNKVNLRPWHRLPTSHLFLGPVLGSVLGFVALSHSPRLVWIPASFVVGFLTSFFFGHGSKALARNGAVVFVVELLYLGGGILYLAVAVVLVMVCLVVVSFVRQSIGSIRNVR
jgi:hypothetical protein